jgi:hypothetical protein
MFKCIANLNFNGVAFFIGETYDEKSLKNISEDFVKAHFKEVEVEETEEEVETEEETTETEEETTPTRRRRSN